MHIWKIDTTWLLGSDIERGAIMSERYEEQPIFRNTLEHCHRNGKLIRRFDYNFKGHNLSYIIYNNDDNGLIYEFTMMDGIILNVTTY